MNTKVRKQTDKTPHKSNLAIFRNYKKALIAINTLVNWAISMAYILSSGVLWVTPLCLQTPERLLRIENYAE